MIKIDISLIVAVIMFIVGLEIGFFGMANDKKRIIYFGFIIHIISLIAICLLLFR